MEERIERKIEEVKEIKEKEKPIVRIGLISDTQDIKEPEEIIERLKEVEEMKPFDFIFHLGDLAPSGKLSDYVKEYKKLSATLKEQEKSGKFTKEILEFKRMAESDDYRKFEEQAKQNDVDRVAIYGLYKATKTGEFNKIIKDVEENNKKIIESFKRLKSKVIHQMGNADKAFPEKTEVLKQLFQKYEISSYNEPTLFDFGEVGVVSWPSLNAKKPEVKALLERKIKDFAEKLKNKKQVIILGHEQPFKGPKLPGVYRERIEKAGYITTRYPAEQFREIVLYALRLLKQLPKETKITYLCGHLHDPTEIIEAGIPYLKRKLGEEKIEMRLFGLGEVLPEQYKDFKGRKTLDIIYLPQGSCGILEVTKEGEVIFEKK